MILILSPSSLWGVVAMAMAAVKNFPGLIVSRLILGILEAGKYQLGK